MYRARSAADSDAAPSTSARRTRLAARLRRVAIVVVAHERHLQLAADVELGQPPARHRRDRTEAARELHLLARLPGRQLAADAATRPRLDVVAVRSHPHPDGAGHRRRVVEQRDDPAERRRRPRAVPDQARALSRLASRDTPTHEHGRAPDADPSAATAAPSQSGNARAAHAPQAVAMARAMAQRSDTRTLLALVWSLGEVGGAVRPRRGRGT